MKDVQLNPMNNEFSVKEITYYDEWINLWEQVSFANLMQSWEYGEAKEFKNGNQLDS